MREVPNFFATLGNVAAATSTGGTVGKLPGRVGDTPGVSEIDLRRSQGIKTSTMISPIVLGAVLK